MISVLASKRISPVSLSIMSLAITLPKRYSKGAWIAVTLAASSSFLCFALILLPFAAITSLPARISNSAIEPTNLAGSILMLQFFAFSLIEVFSKNNSRIAFESSPIALSKVVTGSFLLLSILTNKLS